MLKPIFHDPVKAASPRAALASLAEYLPVFTRPGFEFGRWTKLEPAGENTMVMGYFSMGPEAHAFMVGAYEHGGCANLIGRIGSAPRKPVAFSRILRLSRQPIRMISPAP